MEFLKLFQRFIINLQSFNLWFVHEFFDPCPVWMGLLSLCLLGGVCSTRFASLCWNPDVRQDIRKICRMESLVCRFGSVCCCPIRKAFGILKVTRIAPLRWRMVLRKILIAD